MAISKPWVQIIGQLHLVYTSFNWVKLLLLLENATFGALMCSIGKVRGGANVLTKTIATYGSRNVDSLPILHLSRHRHGSRGHKKTNSQQWWVWSVLDCRKHAANHRYENIYDQAKVYTLSCAQHFLLWICKVNAISRVPWPGNLWMPFTFQPALRALQEPHKHSHCKVAYVFCI